MEFLIVSGLSGGGKSRAADVLEDLDFYCVDNMPTALLTKFAELCLATRGRYEKVALVTDIRSQESFSELWHPYRIPNPHTPLCDFSSTQDSIPSLPQRIGQLRSLPAE